MTIPMPAAVAASAPTTIRISGLNFFYGAFQGLKNINLNIHEKKVTAFIVLLPSLCLGRSNVCMPHCTRKLYTN